MPAAKTNMQQRRFILRNLADRIQALLDKRHNERKAAHEAARKEMAQKFFDTVFSKNVAKQAFTLGYISNKAVIAFEIPKKFMPAPLEHGVKYIRVNPDISINVPMSDLKFGTDLCDRLTRLEARLLFQGSPEAQDEYSTFMAELLQAMK